MIKLKITDGTDGKVGADIGFERLARVTGYLTNIARCNVAKQAEIRDRVKHFGEDKNEQKD